jgi:hypothetical protein
MTNVFYDTERLASLLGVSRSDNMLQAFIDRFSPPPIITVYKEDDEDREYLEFKEEGFEFCFDSDVLLAIFLYSGGKDSDYSGYCPPLPMGICFHHSKSELLDLLPHPNDRGGGYYQIDDGRMIPDWIRFDNEDGHSVHVEFTSDRRNIRMVTLMLLR